MSAGDPLKGLVHICIPHRSAPCGGKDFVVKVSLLGSTCGLALRFCLASLTNGRLYPFGRLSISALLCLALIRSYCNDSAFSFLALPLEQFYFITVRFPCQGFFEIFLWQTGSDFNNALKDLSLPTSVRHRFLQTGETYLSSLCLPDAGGSASSISVGLLSLGTILFYHGSVSLSRVF